MQGTGTLFVTDMLESHYDVGYEITSEQTGGTPV